MNERSITVEVLKDLRRSLPAPSEVIKHMDTGMRGFPDLSAGCLDRISYVELKYWKTDQKLADLCDGPQLLLCHRLGEVHRRRAWVVIYREAGMRFTRRTIIWEPRALFAHLWPKVAGPDGFIARDGVEVTGEEFLAMAGRPGYLNIVLKTHGSLTTDWSYSVPSYLILNSLQASHD